MTEPDTRESGAVVVPLVANAVEAESHDAALRMFADGEGLLVRWAAPGDGAKRDSWGPAVSASSSLAKSLNQISGIGQHFGSGAQRAIGAGTPLFTVELPPGQTIDNMVRAVGGGFRGITRTANSSKIAGQVRLQQVAGAGAATATGIALGPLVGLIALSVTTEMLAQRQMDKKLRAIQATVDDIRRHLLEQDEAVLSLADKTLKQVTAYLLDRVDIPTVAAVDTIFGQLAHFHEVRLNRLQRWEAVADWAEAKELKDHGVDAPTLMARLSDSKEDTVRKFAQGVEETYRVLALQARVATLKRIQIAVLDPDAAIPNVEAAVNLELDTISANQERLRDLLGRLTSLRLTNGFFSTPGTDRTTVDSRTVIGKLAYQLALAPPAVPVLTAGHRPVIELQRRTDGSFAVLAPAV